MNFNKHSQFEGLHSFLSPSNYHWINYTEEKLVERYYTYQAAQRGSVLHEFAMNAINLGIKLPRSKKTLNMYVNDAIGFKMNTEQTLFYSENCFGTTDAISFKNNLLRIHDLKSGVTKVSMNQLRVYAALFCLEYDKKPDAIDVELRIYFNDDVVIEHPEDEHILEIMHKIVMFDRKIELLKIKE